MRGISRLAVAGLLLGVTAMAFQRLPAQRRAERGSGFLPRPGVARAAAFGFEALAADYYWLRAVQIVGRALRPEHQAALLGRLVELVTTLNPWVDHPYRFAAVWLTDSERSVRTANRVLRRGIAYHPKDWRNRFHLGFNHFFYLEEEAEAARVLEDAIGLPGTPVYLRRLLARLKAQTGSLAVAAAFLHELSRTTPDPRARAEYEKALDEIETERRARALDRARALYRQRAGRDITRVEDLVTGPDAVLRRLPAELHGWEWVIDEKTGRIVSSYYGHRYEIQIHAADRARRDSWRKQRTPARAPADG